MFMYDPNGEPAGAGTGRVTKSESVEDGQRRVDTTMTGGNVPAHLEVDPDDQVVTLKVDKEVKEMTLGQLKAQVQKGLSADKRFQEASDLRKEAEEALIIRSDVATMLQGGEDAVGAFERVASKMGISKEEIEEVKGTLTVGEQTPGAGAKPAGQEEEVPVGIQDLAPELQRAFLDAEQGRVEKIIQKSLDKDEDMCYYMKRYDADGQKAVRAMVDREITRRLAQSDGDFGDGARILSQVLPDVKDILKKVGSPERETPPRGGLGPAPGGGSGVHPAEAPKHVASTDPGFEQNITDLMHHRFEQGENAK